MSKPTKPIPAITSDLHAFHQGVIAALAIVNLHNQEVIYTEIVNSVGEDQLLASALHEPEDWQWAGLSLNGYRRKPRHRHTQFLPAQVKAIESFCRWFDECADLFADLATHQPAIDLINTLNASINRTRQSE